MSQFREAKKTEKDAVAVIGFAFRFPGDLADDASFWEALRQKKDLITQVPDDRWACDELQHTKRTEPGRSITFAAGVLSRIDEFDAEFFGISPREAAWLDPQQRLLLELSWEAMENAGVPASKLSGSDCAVYVGISSLDYGTRGLDDLAAMSSHSMTGNTLSIAANRLSYVFDLHGPSLAIDTACSSSLVALHHACRALQTGEASTALVGGVNLLLHPYPFIGFTKASMLSADGRCKSFDESGNGYVRAEGGAVFLLKPLANALADGDDIHAIILGTGVNADGARKTGITIPSHDGQAELMKSVLDQTGLSAHDIDFIEAHGTGTQVGDPIETAAIGSVYGHGRSKPLPIGSVKANLGHMEAASGMAGLVKAMLVLRHRAVPPQIHLKTPNPNIDFAELNLQPVTEYHMLEKDAPLVVGVNSFGFGGANAHVLLKEYRQVDQAYSVRPSKALPPLFLSARTEKALQALSARYVAWLQEVADVDYYDIAYTAAYRRERMEKRLALQPGTPEDVAEKLSIYAAGGMPEGLVVEDRLPHEAKIAFIYSGNGAQWLGMGVRLMEESPEFRAILDELDARMQPVCGFSLQAELNATEESSRLDDTTIAQPLLFAIQVALTRLLEEQGIKPQAVAGHSVGEVAAAWAAGALDLDAAIQVIVERSRSQGETRGTGRMAAVGLSVEAFQAVMAELGSSLDITIAGINSPKNLTISGHLADLEQLQSYLEPKGIFFRLLDLDYAFHSNRMDPIREQLLTNLAGLEVDKAEGATFVSTVTGGVLDTSQLDAEYWWRNVREPVQFSDAIQTLSNLGCRVFIEIGPHAILQRYINECLQAAEVKGRVLSTLRKGGDGRNAIIEVALRAHLLAEPTNFDSYFPQPGRHVRLPNYPWQRERHWHPRTSESLLAIERRRVHPLLGWRIPEAEHSWENVLDPLILPWLLDHEVGGAVVFPGAAYAEMALAAAREWLGERAVALEEMDIVSPMVFDGDHARTLRFELDDRDGSFRIKSRQRLTEDEWTLHAAGRILQLSDTARNVHIASLSSNSNTIDRETHYRLASKLGLEYGPSFQGLREAVVEDDILLGGLDYHAAPDGEGYLVHPALLDVCFQSLIDFFYADIEAGRGVALLPVKIGRFEHFYSGKLSRFRARLALRSARSVLVDFELFDDEGSLLAKVRGCRFRAAPLVHQKAEEKISRWRIDPWLCPHPAESLVTEFIAPQKLVETLQLAMAEQTEARSHWFKEALPLLEALVISFTFEAFQAIARTDNNAFQELITASDPYSRWLGSLLRQEGLLTLQEGSWQLADSSDLPAAEDIWRMLMRDCADALPSLVLLGRIGRHLPNLLLNPSERPAFLTTLRNSPVAETLYQEDPAYVGMRQAIEHILGQLARDWPVHRRLRILEITDGLSEIPRTLMAALPEDHLDYVLAFPETVAQYQQVGNADHPNLIIATLDCKNWQLKAETPLPDKFDVVILRHTLHKAKQPKIALGQVRSWLAANGCFIVAERYPDWSVDFVNGLDVDWWHEEAGGEAPHSSLAPIAVWTELLRSEGFEDVQKYCESAAEGLSEGAYLVLARAPEKWKGSLPAPQPESWLLLVDDASQLSAKSLSAKLEAQGQNVEVVHHLPQAPVSFDHVVFLRGWGDTPESSPIFLASILRDVQALAGHSEKMPRLWFITRGGALASNLPPMVESNPQQAALWGFVRVLMNEYPQFNCTLIDFASQGSFDRLAHELLHPDGENEILLADTGRYTLVMKEESEEQVQRAASGERFRLDFHVPGQFRNLVWLPQEKEALEDHAVEVEVQATGLNFRDIMYLMGLLPDEAVEKGFAGASLGLEFSGIVSRVGSSVRDFRPGDRVMGFGSACFASHVVTRANALARMPEEWSFESAATVPTVFFTVYYALKHLANLQAGERVLIHGGAGGVGIAAIQLAKHLGAEVFATAGSEEKRDFVRLLGADHVFDSRSLAFADEILAVTQGEGVDVVLNSLAGEAIRRNLAVLKPFGRFLELGKRDFFENTPIGLRPFKDNISYFGIDADQLLTGRPQLAAQLFRELMNLFHEGVLTPLPCRVFPAERVVDAFRTMQQARHIGKVVVSLANAQPVLERPAAPVQFQLTKPSTWIVTGGLSGFGLESARWLADHGAEKLILVGRRGIDTPGAREAITELVAKGVEVEAVACDITDSDAVVGMIEDARKKGPPIQGILHAAAIFDDALVQNLDPARLEAVIAPKLLGAWNLHQATLDIPLEYFVLYSSITTAIGNPGQANYVAANAGLEGLAALRRQLGLPATCIGWGPIGDAGYLARNEAVHDNLVQRLGKASLTANEALEQLKSLSQENRTLAVANLNWTSLSRLLPSSKSSRFTVLNRTLGPAGFEEGEMDLHMLIAGKSREEVVTIVQQLVCAEIAQILAISADRVDPEKPLHNLGLDSLMAVELALALEKRLDIQLPVMLLNESATVKNVSLYFVEKIMGESDEASTGEIESVVHGLAEQHGESLSEADILQLTEGARLLQHQGTRLTK